MQLPLSPQAPAQPLVSGAAVGFDLPRFRWPDTMLRYCEIENVRKLRSEKMLDKTETMVV